MLAFTQVKMRPGPQAISADQTVGPKNRPGRRTNVSALEDRRAETRPVRGQMHPAASDTRCVRQISANTSGSIFVFLSFQVFFRFWKKAAQAYEKSGISTDRPKKDQGSSQVINAFERFP
jgi:hypothetical protein